MTGPGGASARALGAFAIVGWLVAGVCWLAALFLPWASSGSLSSASLVDAARLVRRGLVDSLVPEALSFVLLVPAGAAVGLLALAGARGRVAVVVRVLLAALASALVLLITHRIAGGDVARVGAGAWTALAGVLAAAVTAVAVLVEAFGSRREAPPRSAVEPSRVRHLRDEGV